MKNRAGEYKRTLTDGYETYMPAPLPPAPPIMLDADGIKLLIQANRQLAVLDGLAARLPNMEAFAPMFVCKEALLSAQIEGSTVTLDDVLMPAEHRSEAAAEVINGARATNYAMRRDLPLGNQLIQEAHAVLLTGAPHRKQDHQGYFRRTQNWVGSIGDSPKGARYVPPAPEDMQQAMADLEAYLSQDDGQDPLIRAALILYQFETVCPFAAGSGRVGRLLVLLFLMRLGLLSRPVLCLSHFLRFNRVEYLDRLAEVRKAGDYEQWVMFFLRAAMESAAEGVKTIDQLTALHDANLAKLDDSGKQTENQRRVFLHLTEHPILEIQSTAEALFTSYNAVARAVTALQEKGILEQTIKVGRTRLYSYTAYLDILRKGTE